MIEQTLQKLQKIQKVEASQKIFYQLEDCIEQLEVELISYKWALSGSSILVAFLILNIFIYRIEMNSNVQSFDNYSNYLHLNSSNQLYYE